MKTELKASKAMKSPGHSNPNARIDCDITTTVGGHHCRIFEENVTSSAVEKPLSSLEATVRGKQIDDFFPYSQHKPHPPSPKNAMLDYSTPSSLPSPTSSLFLHRPATPFQTESNVSKVPMKTQTNIHDTSEKYQTVKAPLTTTVAAPPPAAPSSLEIADKHKDHSRLNCKTLISSPLSAVLFDTFSVLDVSNYEDVLKQMIGPTEFRRIVHELRVENPGNSEATSNESTSQRNGEEENNEEYGKAKEVKSEETSGEQARWRKGEPLVKTPDMPMSDKIVAGERKGEVVRVEICPPALFQEDILRRHSTYPSANPQSVSQQCTQQQQQEEEVCCLTSYAKDDPPVHVQRTEHKSIATVEKKTDHIDDSYISDVRNDNGSIFPMSTSVPLSTSTRPTSTATPTAAHIKMTTNASGICAEYSHCSAMKRQEKMCPAVASCTNQFPTEPLQMDQTHLIQPSSASSFPPLDSHAFSPLPGISSVFSASSSPDVTKAEKKATCFCPTDDFMSQAAAAFSTGDSPCFFFGPPSPASASPFSTQPLSSPSARHLHWEQPTPPGVRHENLYLQGKRRCKDAVSWRNDGDGGGVQIEASESLGDHKLDEERVLDSVKDQKHVMCDEFNVDDDDPFNLTTLVDRLQSIEALLGSHDIPKGLCCDDEKDYHNLLAGPPFSSIALPHDSYHVYGSQDRRLPNSFSNLSVASPPSTMDRSPEISSPTANTNEFQKKESSLLQKTCFFPENNNPPLLTHPTVVLQELQLAPDVISHFTRHVLHFYSTTQMNCSIAPPLSPSTSLPSTANPLPPNSFCFSSMPQHCFSELVHRIIGTEGCGGFLQEWSSGVGGDNSGFCRKGAPATSPPFLPLHLPPSSPLVVSQASTPYSFYSPASSPSYLLQQPYDLKSEDLSKDVLTMSEQLRQFLLEDFLTSATPHSHRAAPPISSNEVFNRAASWPSRFLDPLSSVNTMTVNSTNRSVGPSPLSSPLNIQLSLQDPFLATERNSTKQPQQQVEENKEQRAAEPGPSSLSSPSNIQLSSQNPFLSTGRNSTKQPQQQVEENKEQRATGPEGSWLLPCSTTEISVLSSTTSNPDTSVLPSTTTNPALERDATITSSMGSSGTIHFLEEALNLSTLPISLVDTTSLFLPLLSTMLMETNEEKNLKTERENGTNVSTDLHDDFVQPDTNRSVDMNGSDRCAGSGSSSLRQWEDEENHHYTNEDQCSAHGKLIIDTMNTSGTGTLRGTEECQFYLEEKAEDMENGASAALPDEHQQQSLDLKWMQKPPLTAFLNGSQRNICTQTPRAWLGSSVNCCLLDQQTEKRKKQSTSTQTLPFPGQDQSTRCDKEEPTSTPIWTSTSSGETQSATSLMTSLSTTTTVSPPQYHLYDYRNYYDNQYRNSYKWRADDDIIDYLHR